jgi:hypothetical protein
MIGKEAPDSELLGLAQENYFNLSRILAQV